MRWVTYRTDDSLRTGLIEDGQVHGLPPGIALLDLLGDDGERLRAAAERARHHPFHTASLEDVRVLAPIPRPPSVRDFLCFFQHARNVRRAQGRDEVLAPVWGQIPALYFASTASILGPFDEVPIFPGSRKFDLELEVGAIIGRPGRDLDPETAHEHIVGYTMFCDWTARDVQAHESQFTVSQAKAKDGGTTLGPWLVTVDELADIIVDGQPALEVSATVNGQELARGRLDTADWRFGEVIAYASRGVDLYPGDVIGSGTLPLGCLAEHVDPADPDAFGRWLKPGDVVSIGCDRLGYTGNRVVEGAPIRRLRTGY